MEQNRRNMLVALVITSVTFMELLDATILNTALPKIAETMSVGVLDLKAAITSYLVSLAVFIPVSGWIADRFGTKRTILCAVCVFTLSSALCGLSRSLPMLITFRVLQGVGGALMTPVARLIMVRLFHKDELVRVAGLVAIPIVFGPLLGPLIGGYLTTRYSWPWIFYVNVPVGILAFIMICALLENSTEADTPPFDLKGFFLSAVALSSLTIAIESIDNHSIPRLWLAVAGFVGAAFLALVVLHCRKRDDGIFDLSLFANSTFRTGFLQTVIGLIGAGGIPFLMAVMLQAQFGMTPLQCGTLLFAAPVGAITMKPFISPIILRFGYKTVLTAFPVLMALGICSFSLIDEHSSRLLIGGLLFFHGLWLSVQMNMINAIPYIDIPGGKKSRATSLQSTNVQFSMSLGITLAALLLNSMLSLQGLRLGTPGDMRSAVSVFHSAYVILALTSALSAIPAMNFRYAREEGADNL